MLRLAFSRVDIRGCVRTPLSLAAIAHLTWRVSSYRLARGGYRQLHEVIHPELLSLKRQQQQQQQQLAMALEALRISRIDMETLRAQVAATRCASVVWCAVCVRVRWCACETQTDLQVLELQHVVMIAADDDERHA